MVRESVMCVCVFTFIVNRSDYIRKGFSWPEVNLGFVSIFHGLLFDFQVDILAITVVVRLQQLLSTLSATMVSSPTYEGYLYIDYLCLLCFLLVGRINI